MITDDYVSFETAKLLKEKGFKKWCHKCYGTAVCHKGVPISFDEECELESEGLGDEIEYIEGGCLYNFGCNNSEEETNLWAAPTLWVAMKWLREVHDIYIMIDKDFATEKGWHYVVVRKQDWADNIDNGLTQQESNSYTYEFACEAAIKYCLKNLIDIGMSEQTNMATRYEREIPEGYEAKIEGNKVIFKLKESEDDRIRKAISYAIGAATHQDGTLINDVTKDEALAYLEKQKEHESINESNIHEPTLDEVRKWNEAYEKGYSLGYENGRNEQKPAEWSEEDKKMLNGIIERGNSEIPKGECGLTPNQVAWLETRLKSIRPQPHWKPSEVQMDALAWYSGNSGVPPTGDKAIKSLYYDLKEQYSL